MSLDRIELRDREEQISGLSTLMGDTARLVLQSPHLDARRLQLLLGAAAQVGAMSALGLPLGDLAKPATLASLTECKPWEMPG